VEGLKKYLQTGLRVPEKVRKATQEYRTSQDTVARFLTECTVADANVAIEASVLYSGYKVWAERNGEKRVSSTAFGTEIKKIYKSERKNRHAPCCLHPAPKISAFGATIFRGYFAFTFVTARWLAHHPEDGFVNRREIRFPSPPLSKLRGF